MRAVKSTRNKSTELRFRAGIIKAGLRGWTVRPAMEYRPDFAFGSRRLAVFIDGCFWHGCPHCRKIPSNNSVYWSAKIARNKRRDRKAARALRAKGWRVIRFWEHQVRSNLGQCISVVKHALYR